MKITRNKAVLINYSVKDEEGNLVDASKPGEPLMYFQGNGQLIPGLERALEDKEAGDKFTVSVPPSEAYGEFDPSLVTEVPREKFDGADEIQVGMQFQAASQFGVSIVKVVKVADDKITIDANHELAGKTLTFDIEVVQVREADEEELVALHSGGGCGGCSGCGSGGCGDGGCGDAGSGAGGCSSGGCGGCGC